MITRHGICSDISFKFTIASNQSNANLRTLAVAAGWNTVAPVIATINSGVVISGSGAAALTINGSWPLGVTLINNGTIYGGNGTGGAAGSGAPGGNGTAGQHALSVSVAAVIANNGTLAGGGGGGGGGGGSRNFDATVNWDGGTGGAGAYGVTAATNGTPGAYPGASPGYGGYGGTGGALGTAGQNGADGRNDVAGNVLYNGGVGGTAGSSVSGNSNVIWRNTGTRTGPLT